MERHLLNSKVAWVSIIGAASILVLAAWYRRCASCKKSEEPEVEDDIENQTNKTSARPQLISVMVEDSNSILQDDIKTKDKLKELAVSVADSLPQDTHPALLLCVEHLVDRVNRSLLQKLRERCIRTAGNCVLVVVHGSKTSQSVLDSIRDEYNTVSGLTRSADKKQMWTNNHDDAAVEFSQIIFVEGVTDDSGAQSILQLKNPDQLINHILKLANKM